MNMKTLFKASALVTLLFVQSCATKEEIERRKLLARLATEMNSTQSTSSDLVTRLMDIEERLGMIQGRVEENQHKTIEDQAMRAKSVEEEIGILKAEIKNLKDENVNIQQKLESNEKYLKQVLSKLDSLSGGGKKSGGKATSKSNSYDQAMADYKKGRYSAAKPQLLELLNSNKYKGNDRARILHNLGLIDFMDNKFDSALVYFSKLFTEFPKSGYNKRGLLFMGKSFTKLGKKDEARQALQELVSNFPKSSQATEAKKLLKAL